MLQFLLNTPNGIVFPVRYTSASIGDFRVKIAIPSDVWRRGWRVKPERIDKSIVEEAALFTECLSIFYLEAVVNGSLMYTLLLFLQIET